jgi:hypothetical protein
MQVTRASRVAPRDQALHATSSGPTILRLGDAVDARLHARRRAA